MYLWAIFSRFTFSVRQGLKLGLNLKYEYEIYLFIQ